MDKTVLDIATDELVAKIAELLHAHQEGDMPAGDFISEVCQMIEQFNLV